jgi:hypothetical protein
MDSDAENTAAVMKPLFACQILSAMSRSTMPLLTMPLLHKSTRVNIRRMHSAAFRHHLKLQHCGTTLTTRTGAVDLFGKHPLL